MKACDVRSKARGRASPNNHVTKGKSAKSPGLVSIKQRLKYGLDFSIIRIFPVEHELNLLLVPCAIGQETGRRAEALLLTFPVKILVSHTTRPGSLSLKCHNPLYNLCLFNAIGASSPCLQLGRSGVRRVVAKAEHKSQRSTTALPVSHGLRLRLLEAQLYTAILADLLSVQAGRNSRSVMRLDLLIAP